MESGPIDLLNIDRQMADTFETALDAFISGSR